MTDRLTPIGGPVLIKCSRCQAGFYNGGSWDWARTLCAGCEGAAAGEALAREVEREAWRAFDAANGVS